MTEQTTITPKKTVRASGSNKSANGKSANGKSNAQKDPVNQVPARTDQAVNIPVEVQGGQSVQDPVVPVESQGGSIVSGSAEKEPLDELNSQSSLILTPAQHDTENFRIVFLGNIDNTRINTCFRVFETSTDHQIRKAGEELENVLKSRSFFRCLNEFGRTVLRNENGEQIELRPPQSASRLKSRRIDSDNLDDEDYEPPSGSESASESDNDLRKDTKIKSRKRKVNELEITSTTLSREEFRKRMKRGQAGKHAQEPIDRFENVKRQINAFAKHPGHMEREFAYGCEVSVSMRMLAQIKTVGDLNEIQAKLRCSRQLAQLIETLSKWMYPDLYPTTSQGKTNQTCYRWQNGVEKLNTTLFLLALYDQSSLIEISDNDMALLREWYDDKKTTLPIAKLEDYWEAFLEAVRFDDVTEITRLVPLLRCPP